MNGGRDENDTPRKVDDILSRINERSWYVHFLLVLLSVTWAMDAMIVMVSAFLADDEEQPKNGSQYSEGNRTTLIAEFGLTGESKYLADASTSAFMLGNIIGGSVLSIVSDRYGRRKVLILCVTVLGLSGTMSSFSPTIYFFIIGRFIQGVMEMAANLSVWVLACECAPSSLRGYTTLLFGSMWVLGYTILTPLAYLITQWRWLMLSISAPCFLLTIIYFLAVPESLHFLIANKRESEAVKWPKSAKRCRMSWDKDEITKMVTDVMKSSNVQTSKTISLKTTRCKSWLRALTSNRTFIFYTAVFIYLWTCDAFVYYGLSLYSTRLVGNRYWNFALSGLVELPAYIFMPWTLNNVGRKKIVLFTHLITATSLIGLMFIPEGVIWLFVTCWLLGKFATACSYMSTHVYGSEIFPTTMRNGCIGLCSVVARASLITAPYVKLLETFNRLLPLTFFGAIALFAGILSQFLPETKDRPLPECMEDFKKINK